MFDSPGGLFGHGGHFAVHIEDFAFVHGQRFDAVLVGVGVDGLFKALAQQVLAALGVGNKAVDGEYQVIGNQGVGAGEITQRALDD